MTGDKKSERHAVALRWYWLEGARVWVEKDLSQACNLGYTWLSSALTAKEDFKRLGMELDASNFDEFQVA